MEKLKRYGFTVWDDGATPIEDSSGAWVKFSDIKDILKPSHNKHIVQCTMWKMHDTLSCMVGFKKKCGKLPCIIAQHK